ncbi:MAG: hypothetical protein M2R45_03286 [Verrucomicrobia subdivision 3 bacterium]|nr:hypothetical protein [Limisphaerales bacterium]MCS1416146.1 hypothetical protein [Limisphaerales bacterium]
MKLKHIAYFAYPVSDVLRARDFYENTLQLPPAENFNNEWIEYELEGVTFAITNIAKDLQPGAKGGFLAIEVEDLDAAVAEMKAKKVPFLLDTFDSPVCRMAVIADPDGNGVMLHKLKESGS